MNTVLFADDNAVNRELVRAFLEAAGYAVIEASNGQEALELVRAHQPDLILLDVQMPRRDGLQVVADLRRDPQFTNLPAIALTAFAMRGDDERVLAAGFNAYLTKPVDFPALIAEIEAQLARKGGG